METVERVTEKIPTYHEEDESEPEPTVDSLHRGGHGSGGGDAPVGIGGIRDRRSGGADENPAAAGDDGPNRDADSPRGSASGASAAHSPTAGDPLADLIKQGSVLLANLAETLSNESNRDTHSDRRQKTNSSDAKNAPRRPIESAVDETTGERFLKVRMPEPHVMQGVATALQSMLGGFLQHLDHAKSPFTDSQPEDVGGKRVGLDDTTPTNEG